MQPILRKQEKVVCRISLYFWKRTKYPVLYFKMQIRRKCLKYGRELIQPSNVK